MGRTLVVDRLDICLNYVMNLAEKCIHIKIIEGLYYLVHGLAMKEGLRKIVEDDVFQLGQTTILNRCVDMYMFWLRFS